MDEKYEVSIEVSGPTAMWTRPDTGDCPVSYPAPTYSAAKGIFESILWGPAIEIIPTKTEICSPVTFHNYQTNYGGPLRKTSIMPEGSFQLLATVLINVCYRFYAEVIPIEKNRKKMISAKAKLWDTKTTSPGHAYYAIFNRRIERGQCFAVPFLGWKEFPPDYIGPFRSTTCVREDINMVLPSMLRQVFPDGYKSEVRFSYEQNVVIKNGVLIYLRKGERQC